MLRELMPVIACFNFHNVYTVRKQPKSLDADAIWVGRSLHFAVRSNQGVQKTRKKAGSEDNMAKKMGMKKGGRKPCWPWGRG